MSVDEIAEAEVIEGVGTEIETYTAQAPSLFRTDDPVEVVAKATQIADALKAVVVRQKLSTKIGTSEHLRVEAWQTLGSMLGVFPVKEWVRVVPWPDPVPSPLTRAHGKGLAFGFEASFLAQTAQGAIVGGGEGACMRTESTWASRDDYALRSMAQTRATSRALKAPLGFVVSLAGYDTTPAEEMTAARGHGRMRVKRAVEEVDVDAEVARLTTAILELAGDRDAAQAAIDKARANHDRDPGGFLAWLGAQLERAENARRESA